MKLEAFAKKFGYRCYWCGHMFPIDQLSRDHIEPVNQGTYRHCSKGGVKTCVLACKVCNATRGNTPFNVYEKLTKNDKKTNKKAR